APARGHVRALRSGVPGRSRRGGPAVLVTAVGHRPRPTHTAVSEPKQSVHTARLGCSDVETFVIRLWLPGRPGALGQAASRIGAARVDAVGIATLERGDGRAGGEVRDGLPARTVDELWVSEVRQAHGVAVEEVRHVADARHDPRVDV